MNRRKLLWSALAGGSSLGQIRPSWGQKINYTDPPLTPANLKKMPDRVQQAYGFAQANPKILKQFPCYCGCYQSVGHNSSYDCFMYPENIYNSHGSRCGVCLDVALTVQQDDQSKIPINQSIKKLNLRYKNAPRMPGFPA